MKYKRPSLNDFEKIVNLQNKNLVSSLNTSEQADGFLSASLSSEQFKEMNDDLAIVICSDLHNLCGFLCASSIEYNQKIPLVAAMINQLPYITYQGKKLDTYKAFIAGPVCIDKEYRGKDIFINLYAYLLHELKKEYPKLELALTLISNKNQRSINAHKKVGMEKVSEFEFNGSLFSILVRNQCTLPSLA